MICYYPHAHVTTLCMTSLMRSIGIVHGPAKPAQWYFGWPLEDVLPSATPRKCWHWAAPGIVSRNAASSRAHRDQFNGTNNCGHVGNIWTGSTHYQLKAVSPTSFPLSYDLHVDSPPPHPRVYVVAGHHCCPKIPHSHRRFTASTPPR
jgi:hypothetical protein